MRTKHKNRQSELRPCSRRGDHGLTSEDWQTLEREIPSALKASEEKDRVFKAEVDRRLKELEDQWKRGELKKRSIMSRPVQGRNGEPLLSRDLSFTQRFKDWLDTIEDPKIRKLAEDEGCKIQNDAMLQIVTGKRRILS